MSNIIAVEETEGGWCGKISETHETKDTKMSVKQDEPEQKRASGAQHGVAVKWMLLGAILIAVLATGCSVTRASSPQGHSHQSKAHSGAITLTANKKCPSSAPTAVSNEGVDLSGKLVPSGANRLKICRYSGPISKSHVPLISSAMINSPKRVERFARLLDSFSPAPHTLTCPNETRKKSAVAVFSYPNRSHDVAIDIHLAGCAVASNGKHAYVPTGSQWDKLSKEVNRLASVSGDHHNPGRHASIGNKGRVVDKLRCNSSYDPYEVPRSFLKKCGIKIYPLKAVKKLPDRGREYIYRAEGVKQIYKIPPESFNPLKASPKQLDEYGFPPRPSGGPELKQWKRMAENFHFVKPPPYLVKGEFSGAGSFSGDSSKGSTGASGR
ncbi:MAG: hypothetical protein IRY88_16655 [Rubrobacteraceae bacterium]|nr:hypothetical protein [Rubrobacteraceae bacterium]